MIEEIDIGKMKLKKFIKIVIIGILFALLIWRIINDNFIKSKQNSNRKNNKIIAMYENSTSYPKDNNKIDSSIRFPSDEIASITLDTKKRKEIDDWRLVLVNYENLLPSNFEIELANIDKNRQIDSRVLEDLNNMINSMKKDGVTDSWVQSAYRSVSRQQNLYSERVNTYLKEGKTLEEAEILTQKTINKPETSEHNLGLAIDFNYVNYNFETTKSFEWLINNAENYGFILRYSEEKKEITRVDYEPWHWRYVGIEHAKKMNEMNFCLEEYVEYLYYN